jgi:hypothetical protein
MGKRRKRLKARVKQLELRLDSAESLLDSILEFNDLVNIAVKRLAKPTKGETP